MKNFAASVVLAAFGLILGTAFRGANANQSPRFTTPRSPSASVRRPRAARGCTGLGSGAFVGGSDGNVAGGMDAGVVAGQDDDACSDGTMIGSGEGNEIYDTSPFSGEESFIGAGQDNAITGRQAFVGSGLSNSISSAESFIGAGQSNSVSANQASIGGGQGNAIAPLGANTGLDGFVGGGYDNAVHGAYAFIGGGDGNLAAGYMSAIPGGYHNDAAGSFSFAAGWAAVASTNGSFAWSDYSPGSPHVAPTAVNEFVARASGGFELFSNAALTSGVQLAAGSGSWSSLSDRNLKTDIAPLDDARILAKVAALPVSEWSYTSERGVRHLGPMAQDFYAAFRVGEDDRHITTIDEDGVALAAIKALHAENAGLHAENTGLRARLVRDESRLAALERAIAKGLNK